MIDDATNMSEEQPKKKRRLDQSSRSSDEGEDNRARNVSDESGNNSEDLLDRPTRRGHADNNTTGADESRSDIESDDEERPIPQLGMLILLTSHK